MAVLYRKYRPGRFADVVNQKYIIATLKNQVKTGQLAHAYLFTGSRGVGKTSVARILAKAVNCIQRSEYNELHPNAPKGDACGECAVCKQIEQGNFIDLIEVDAASNTGVDNIRDLIEHVKFSPSMGRYKVFIIDEVHMLSKGAFNALLKTLEEPPRHAIFVLATTEAGKVPATIISRTQRFDFKALSAADIAKHLEKILKAEGASLDDGVVQLVARQSGGSVRDALSLLGKVLTLGDGATLAESEQLLGVTDAEWCHKLTALIENGDAAGLPAFFDALLERGLDMAMFNRDYLEFLRQLLVAKISPSDAAGPEVSGFAAKFGLQDIVFVIRLFLRSYKDLNGSPSPELPMLLAAVEAAMRRHGAPPALSADRAADGPKAASPTAAGGGRASIREKPAAYSPKPAEEPKSAPTAPEAAAAEEEHIEEAGADESAGITLEQVMERWNDVVDKLRHINGPLANLVKHAAVLAVAHGRVSLGVKYAFHKQQLENQKDLSIIQKVLAEVYGARLSIRGEVLKDEIKPKATNLEVLSDALQIFGGEVVE